MRLNRKTIGILLIVLLGCVISIEGSSGIYSLSAGENVQITTDESDQRDPAICEDTVVWTDNRNGNIDIYGYDLFTEEEFQITTDESDQWSLAIYEDTIVWTDDRSGGLDIYGDRFHTRSTYARTAGDTLEDTSGHIIPTPPPVTTLPSSSTSPRLSFHGLFYAILVIGLITMIIVGKMSIIKGRLAGKIKEKPERFSK